MPIHPDTKLNLVWTTEDAMDLLRWLGERREGTSISFDTETTGLDPAVDHVRLVQFGDKMTGWAIPFEGNRSFRALVSEIFERWNGDLDAHNTNYDHAMLAAEEIILPTHRMHDTRLMAACLEPEYSNALKSQAARHVDRKAAGASKQLDEVMVKNGWNWATIPIVNDPEHPAYIYPIYGALDTVLTAHLKDVHYPTIQAQCPDAYDLELATAWITRKMQARGVKLDREYTRQKYNAFVDYVEHSAKWIEETWGCKPGTTAKVVAELQSQGAMFVKMTPGGVFSLDRDVLIELAPDYPLAAAILKRRRTEKAAGSFLLPFLEFSARDGRLHPSINSVGGRNKTGGESGGDMGVKTSRMSMADPNLQGMPRVGEGNPAADVVRNCLVSDDDETFVMVDYAQVELRLLAHYSRDKGLQGAFDHDVDAFTALARQIYRDNTIERKDRRRSLTKNATYATGYGAGVNKFSATAGIHPMEGKAFMDQFHATYPGLRMIMSELTRAARTDGYVLSPLTNRRIKAESGLEYKLLNHLIQTTAAEIIKLALVRADAGGLSDYLQLIIHDELVASVPNDMVPEAVEIMVNSMQMLDTFAVPLTVDASTGKRFGEKEPWQA